MAEFGISATNLSAPQGAGATPVQGVQTPPSHPLAYSIPGGLVEVLGSGVKALFNTDPGAELLKKFTRQTNSIADALKQGAISPTEAMDRKQALFREYSSNHPEYIKEFQDIGGWTQKHSGFEDAEAKIKAEAAQEADFRKAAANAGFYIDDKSSPETREAVKEFLADINYTSTVVGNAQAKLSYAASKDKYLFDVTQREEEERIKNSSIRLADTMFQTMNAELDDLRTRVESGDPTMTPDLALQTVRNLSATLNAQVAQLEIIDPARATAIRRVLDQYAENATQLFDPNVAANVKQGIIKNNLNSVKIALMADNELLAHAGMQELFGQTDVLTLNRSNTVLNGMTRLMSTYDNPLSKVPNIVGMGEDMGEKGVYKLFKESVDAWKTGSVQSMSSEETIGRISSSANVLLDQFGGLVDARNATPQDYVAAMDMMASPQFREVVKSGNLNPDAVANAELALVYGFRESQTVRGRFNETLRKTYNQPRPSGALADAVVGESEQFQYVDVIAPRFDAASGTLSFGVERDFQGNLLSRASVNSIIKEFDNNKKALNITIRAHANLLDMDVGEYWEKYKHEILPEYFPDPAVLKPGFVDGGMEYIGGPPARKSSWRPVSSGSDDGRDE